MTVLAIDLGGTRIKMGVIENGAVIRQRQSDARSGERLADRAPEIEASLKDLLNSANRSVSNCAGVGVSSTGLVDRERNRVLSTNKKYEDAPDFDFNQWADRAFGLGCKVENDAHAALLGEWRYGAGRGANNLVMLTLGTGIGSSVVLNGKALRGKNGQAGLLGGHIVVDPWGDRCTCPGVGCAEAQASTWALPGRIARHPKFHLSRLKEYSNPDFKTLFQLANEGDEAAVEIADYCVRVWGAVAVSMIHLFAPEKIILGGGVMKGAAAVLPPIQKMVKEHAWISWEGVDITIADHLESASLLGMAALFESDVEFI
ncbi:MAG: ROK family protein [bacterium]|nr:ROK family protein [bacterium]